MHIDRLEEPSGIPVIAEGKHIADGVEILIVRGGGRILTE
jgi:hypothetical protein